MVDTFMWSCGIEKQSWSIQEICVSSCFQLYYHHKLIIASKFFKFFLLENVVSTWHIVLCYGMPAMLDINQGI